MITQTNLNVLKNEILTFIEDKNYEDLVQVCLDKHLPVEVLNAVKNIIEKEATTEYEKKCASLTQEAFLEQEQLDEQTAEADNNELESDKQINESTKAEINEIEQHIKSSQLKLEMDDKFLATLKWRLMQLEQDIAAKQKSASMPISALQNDEEIIHTHPDSAIEQALSEADAIVESQIEPQSEAINPSSSSENPEDDIDSQQDKASSEALLKLNAEKEKTILDIKLNHEVQDNLSKQIDASKKILEAKNRILSEELPKRTESRLLRAEKREHRQGIRENDPQSVEQLSEEKKDKLSQAIIGLENKLDEEKVALYEELNDAAFSTYLSVLKDNLNQLPFDAEEKAKLTSAITQAELLKKLKTDISVKKQHILNLSNTCENLIEKIKKYTHALEALPLQHLRLEERRAALVAQLLPLRQAAAKFLIMGLISAAVVSLFNTFFGILALPFYIAPIVLFSISILKGIGALLKTFDILKLQSLLHTNEKGKERLENEIGICQKTYEDLQTVEIPKAKEELSLLEAKLKDYESSISAEAKPQDDVLLSKESDNENNTKASPPRASSLGKVGLFRTSSQPSDENNKDYQDLPHSHSCCK